MAPSPTIQTASTATDKSALDEPYELSTSLQENGDGSSRNCGESSAEPQAEPDAESFERPASEICSATVRIQNRGETKTYPAVIDVKSCHNRDRDRSSGPEEPTGHIGFSKRRKINETTFTAANAVSYLEKAELPIPKIKLEKTRELAGFSIDMSKVELSTSKSVGDSPFLTPDRIDEGPPHTADEYVNLFTSTYQSYSKTDGLWNSGTSSVTSSEATNGPAGLAIAPRLEDGLKAPAKAKRITTNSKRSLPSVEPRLPVIAMTTALEVFKVARLVTLSFAPFIIVHVNTAYTELTGLISAKVLGKPLLKFVGGKDSHKMVEACRKGFFPLATMHDQVVKIVVEGNSSGQDCRIKMSLIGPQVQGKVFQVIDPNTVTHYSIAILPDSSNPSSIVG